MPLVRLYGVVLFIGGGAGLVPPDANAQDDNLSTLRGVVRVQGLTRPVAGAEILVDGVVVVRSAEDGTFTIRVSAGSHLLEVRRVGYGMAAAQVDVVGDSDLELDVQLSEKAVPLDTVVIEGEVLTVSPRLAGFYNRRKTWSSGQFFSLDEIQRRQPPRLSDFFRTARNVNVLCNDPTCLTYKLQASRARVLPSFSGGVDDCPMQYYVDGAAWYLGGEGINALPVDDVAAIEVYVGSSQPPVEFSGRDARCGVVVIWTRDGREGSE